MVLIILEILKLINFGRRVFYGFGILSCNIYHNLKLDFLENTLNNLQNKSFYLKYIMVSIHSFL